MYPGLPRMHKKVKKNRYNQQGISNYIYICIKNYPEFITLTMATYGLIKVNANRAWQPIVTVVPRITQKIFLPLLSIRNPNTGEATADMMYTKL